MTTLRITDGGLEALRERRAQAGRIAFIEMSEARHKVALAKLPHVIEHLKDALEEGAVVCFAHHRDIIAALKAEFPDAVTITGDTPLAARQEAVDAFQAGRTNLFIGNIQAAGVGITLTRSAHVIFAELDWVPGNLTQAEDRTHRIGQTASVLVQHLVLEGSVDAIMARKIIAKQEVIAKALDAETAVDFGKNGATEVEIELKPDRIAEETAELATPEASPRIAAIHKGLRMLAGVCDGAQQIDGRGFNKFDTRIGKALAAQATLSPRQAGQLPAALVAAAKGE